MSPRPRTAGLEGVAQDLPATLYLSDLLKRAVFDGGEQPVARLDDVIVRTRGVDYPIVTGLVADVRGRRLFIPADAVVAWASDRLVLASAQVDLRPFERRRGEVLLRADVLGNRLVDLVHRRLARAFDVQLSRHHDQWEASGIDVRGSSWLRPFERRLPRTVRDWKGFAPLVEQGAPVRGVRRTWLRWLKPAEIADLLEAASDAEQEDILAQVHGDRELEADVFEELEQDQQTALLKARTDPEVAEVLSRMHADDAADVLMQLPTDRRQPVLDLMPAPQRTRVMLLLGFAQGSAGGMMGVEFVHLPGESSAADALAAIARAEALQPQALTTVFCTDQDGRLSGAVQLARLVQAQPDAVLNAIGDPHPVRVEASTDITELALLMADHNLLTLPVVDNAGTMIGLITVDDVLDAIVPENWRRRNP